MKISTDYPQITRASRFIDRYSASYAQRFSKTFNCYSEPIECSREKAKAYKAAGAVYAVVAMDIHPDSTHGILLSRSERGDIANAPDTGIVVSSTIDGIEGKRVLVSLGIAPHLKIGDGEVIRICGSVCTFHDGNRPMHLPDDRVIPAIVEEGATMKERISPRGRNILATRRVQEQLTSGLLLSSSSSSKRVVYEVVRVGPSVETISPGDIVLAHPGAVMTINAVDENADGSEDIVLIPEYGIICSIDYEKGPE